MAKTLSSGIADEKWKAHEWETFAREQTGALEAALKDRHDPAAEAMRTWRAKMDEQERAVRPAQRVYKHVGRGGYHLQPWPWKTAAKTSQLP